MSSVKDSKSKGWKISRIWKRLECYKVDIPNTFKSFDVGLSQNNITKNEYAFIGNGMEFISIPSDCLDEIIIKLVKINDLLSTKNKKFERLDKEKANRNIFLKSVKREKNVLEEDEA